MQSIKYIENGRVIAEFTDAQVLYDFIVEKTRRQCEAEYILSQKKREFNLKLKWFVIGIFACEAALLFTMLIKALIK